jgi:hypothetical protein
MGIGHGAWGMDNKKNHQLANRHIFKLTLKPYKSGVTLSIHLEMVKT